MSDLTILQGDNIELCAALAPGSVQCVVTSPPYYGLRDYGLEPTDYPAIDHAPMPGLPSITTPAQLVCLGLESTPEAYIAHLVHLFRIIRPALADDGVMWVNIGDSYAANTTRPGAGRNDENESDLERRAAIYGTGTPKAERQRSDRAVIKSKVPPGIVAKNLIGIPWRLAFALQADGWILRSDVIWHKPNAMPESVTDRCTKDHEYLFMLAKRPRYYFDNEAIKQPFKTIPTERRDRGTEPSQSRAIGQPQQAGVYGDNGRNRRTVWSIATKPLAAAHYAPMPEALAEPCILSSSRPGDLVLDPFGGTGTTARVAIANNRRAIIMDKNPAYIDIQDERTAAIQRRLIEV